MVFPVKWIRYTREKIEKDWLPKLVVHLKEARGVSKKLEAHKALDYKLILSLGNLMNYTLQMLNLIDQIIDILFQKGNTILICISLSHITLLPNTLLHIITLLRVKVCHCEKWEMRRGRQSDLILLSKWYNAISEVRRSLVKQTLTQK